jgi:hypothetical protein
MPDIGADTKNPRPRLPLEWSEDLTSANRLRRDRKRSNRRWWVAIRAHVRCAHRRASPAVPQSGVSKKGVTFQRDSLRSRRRGQPTGSSTCR